MNMLLSRCIILIILLIIVSSNCFALCIGRPLNPITDIRWNCIFPISIAGVNTGTSGNPFQDVADLASSARSPICACFRPPLPVPIPGISVSFEEVIRYIEVVKDPFCMPVLGFPISGTKIYGGTGTGVSASGSNLTYGQTHYAVFLPFALMNIMNDALCGTESGNVNPLNIVYMSELEGVADGSHSSTIATLLTPEAVLLANPVANLYCMGDAVLTATEFTDIAGYWCAGGHSIFPLSNFTTQGVSQLDSASITAAKVIFKLTRLGILPVCMGSQGLCGCYPVPVWNKKAFRLQTAMPISDYTCNRIGKPHLLWGNFPSKNPPGIASADNFVFMLWRHRSCCVL